MAQEEIIERLRNIVKDASVDELDWRAITAETTIESLGFDSLSILDLLYDVEQEFGVSLEAAVVMKIETIGGLADLLAVHIATS